MECLKTKTCLLIHSSYLVILEQPKVTYLLLWHKPLSRNNTWFAALVWEQKPLEQSYKKMTMEAKNSYIRTIYLGTFQHLVICMKKICSLKKHDNEKF